MYRSERYNVYMKCDTMLEERIDDANGRLNCVHRWYHTCTSDARSALQITATLFIAGDTTNPTLIALSNE